MLTQSLFGQLKSITKRNKHFKVSVLGACGGIGQPMSLLLKTNPNIHTLSLYDIKGSLGVSADLSHINTPSKTVGYTPENGGLQKCLEGSDLVLIPAGVPRKPGMSRDDLFNTNASIVYQLAEGCAKHCPKANILVIANPVNSTVPICAKVLEKYNVFDKNKLFGVTTLDLVRACTFVNSIDNNIECDTFVPVVGGHSGQTIVPLFSQLGNFKTKDNEELKQLVNRVQFGGDEVVKAKDGAGSATLSMAYAGAKFAHSVMQGMLGEDVTEIAYVKSDLYKDKGVEYFASKIKLGKNGVQHIYDIGNINSYEKELINEALNQLKGNIKKGIDFANSKKQ